MTSERKPGYLVPAERIEGAILELRGERVMLDADLAAVYGVTTRRLKELSGATVTGFPMVSYLNSAPKSVTRWSQNATTYQD